MGISIDADKVDDLRKLSAFFEFISNPQAYKDFLSEAKAVLGTMDKTITAHTTVEKAEEYLALAQRKVAEVNLAVEEHNKKVAADKQAAETLLEQERAALQAGESRLAEEKIAFAKMSEELKVAQKAAEDFAKSLTARESVLTAKETQYAVRLQAMETKQAKLTELLK